MSGEPLLTLLAVPSKAFLYCIIKTFLRGAGKDLGGAKPKVSGFSTDK